MIVPPDLYVLICDCSSFLMSPRAPFLERGIFLTYEEAMKNIEEELCNEEFKDKFDGFDYVWMIEKFVFDAVHSKYLSDGLVIVHSSESDDTSDDEENV